MIQEALQIERFPMPGRGLTVKLSDGAVGSTALLDGLNKYENVLARLALHQ